MRIIILVLVVFLVYILLKSLFKKGKISKSSGKKSIEYCKYCEAYVAQEEHCTNNGKNFKACKNYK